MEALIFAAGLGTRLKPFTLEHPKALVPVGGVPMLQRVILKLKDVGIRRIVVNVHHFSGQIIDFLRANGDFGLDIAISDESARLLDTGGGILAAGKLLSGDGPVLVHNADIITDFDLSDMMRRHEARGADATLLVAERDTSRYLLIDGDGRMRGWTNVKTGEVRMPDGECADAGFRRRAFGGVHMLSPSVFASIEAYADGRVEFPIMPFYISSCGELRIEGYEPTSPYRWFDVGKPESLRQAEAAFR